MSAIVSLLCSGTCCLAFVAGIAGLLVFVLRRGSGSAEVMAGPVQVRGIPAPVAQPSPAAQKAMAPVKPAGQAAVPPPPPKAAPPPAPAARPIESLDDDQDSYDDDEMATVVAPPPAGMREVSAGPPPPPPPDGRSPGMTDKSALGSRGGPSAAPANGAKPAKTPAPPPPRSSGQTIIAFDDDDEDW